ncbi:MAG: hypothetical protein SFV23_13205, partial [Planctomycetaceae bacterium]|nr:hypothetical protein [Planctomycetaceae bacterium]
MNPFLMYESGRFTWNGDGRRSEHRSGDDLPFAVWRDTSEHALTRPDQAARLASLGQEMFRWLDGPRQWLQALLQSAPPAPLIIEFRAPAQPNAAEHNFLEAPWELLHDGQQHWAAREDLQYCPIRRLGAPQPPAAPSSHRLALAFMAAAPEGEVVLDFEGEEAAILQAAPSDRLDLVVEDSGTLD